MPWLPVTLKCLKPKEPDLDPQTVGEHIRKKRLELGLTQGQAGVRLAATAVTVLHWEKGQTEPPIEAIPGIIEFLGYDPFAEPTGLSERLRAKRREMGWTIKEAARQLGVDEGTWGEWEREGCIPWQRYRTTVESFLAQGGKEPKREYSAKSEKS